VLRCGVRGRREGASRRRVQRTSAPQESNGSRARRRCETDTRTSETNGSSSSSVVAVRKSTRHDSDLTSASTTCTYDSSTFTVVSFFETVSV